MNDELTKEQITQQDKVDGLIHGCVERMVDKRLPWDIEKISQIRNAIIEVYGLDEAKIYPYIDE